MGTYPPVQITLISMGNEHAKRLSNSASSMGHDSQFISFDANDSYLVAMATNVAKAATDELNEEQKANTFIVLAFTDAILYIARSHDRGYALTMLPKKGGHHVNGNLTIGPSDRAKEMVDMVNTILQVAKVLPTLLLAPLTRFLKTKCCANFQG